MLWLVASKALRLARSVAGPLPRHRPIRLWTPLESAVAVQVADFMLELDATPDAVDAPTNSKRQPPRLVSNMSSPEVCVHPFFYGWH